MLTDTTFFEKLCRLTASEPEPEEKEDKKGDINFEAVRVLSLFQRDGRLVDFLREDIQSYENAQIGAAVRSVHQGCRKVLDDYFSLEPVMTEQEGAVVTVRAGFDPSAVRLVGQVAGQPPFRGTVKHHGWRVVRSALPASPEGQDKHIIAPAEVEIS
ncbi:MAG: DUF2760 domain-containing protein [Planctomycetes bacterium]|nr:DUF2760 domain-containing protein [Planctomycetota bacterium]